MKKKTSDLKTEDAREEVADYKAAALRAAVKLEELADLSQERAVRCACFLAAMMVRRELKWESTKS